MTKESKYLRTLFKDRIPRYRLGQLQASDGLVTWKCNSEFVIICKTEQQTVAVIT